jgi:16S rRNA (cytosine1402-N4)-methyltransferase
VSAFVHETVLREETMTALAPRAGGVYADATLGGGGHAEAILEASAPDGRVIGVDRDPHALAAAHERLARFGARATLVHGEFGALREILAEAGAPRVHGVVADVGVSSPQLEEAERGFSFARSGPLDMRMDPTQGETARDLVNRLHEKDLADVIYRYGEERRSRPIARSIKTAIHDGAMETTEDLRRAVVRAIGPQRFRGIDPSTRTFQAIRIAVNRELEELQTLIQDVPELLEDGGVAAVITFHSLEDRIVKHAFRGDPRLEPLTKKPVLATEEEERRNPRSRSAKLRAARRVPRGTERRPHLDPEETMR